MKTKIPFPLKHFIVSVKTKVLIYIMYVHIKNIFSVYLPISRANKKSGLKEFSLKTPYRDEAKSKCFTEKEFSSLKSHQEGSFAGGPPQTALGHCPNFIVEDNHCRHPSIFHFEPYLQDFEGWISFIL